MFMDRLNTKPKNKCVFFQELVGKNTFFRKLLKLPPSV